jgi:3D-(3,5/4)-trihydroxycyclohexane-1,2-dione acylhydrolase (decyclizing)
MPAAVDAQVIGAVQRALASEVIVLLRRAACRASCTSCGRRSARLLSLRIRLLDHGLRDRRRARRQDGAAEDKEVVVMVGDGSYLMLNSEIATSVMLGLKLTIVLLDNRGYRLHQPAADGDGGASFNNLLRDTRHEILPDIDFAAHAKSLGAMAEKVASIADLEAALGRAGQRAHHRRRDRHRPADLDRRGRALVGRRGAGSERARRGQCRAQGL